MRLYSELAEWWSLLSPPSHYHEEAEDLLPELLGATDPEPRTLLELGCGGGSMAWHLMKHFTLTLTDISPAMLEISRSVNPECEHIEGDMRSLELGRTFDLVFIHDAIMYAVTPDDVRATLATAARHCRPGGAVCVVPDYVRETYEPDTSHGGEDGDDGRGLRYVEWHWDPDPGDDTAETAWAFLLREADGTIHVDSDRHSFGLFARAAWLDWLTEAGFNPRSRMDPWDRDVSIGRRTG